MLSVPLLLFAALLVVPVASANRGAVREQPREFQAICQQAIAELVALHRRPEKMLFHERYIDGSHASENWLFRSQLFMRVLEAQTRLAASNGGDRARAQHIKAHGGGGIVTEVEVLPGIPETLRSGFFERAPGSKFVAISRFSSGMGVFQRDGLPDVTGYALMITDVPVHEALRAVEDGRAVQTMDWTFTKSASAFSATPLDFLPFLDVQAETSWFWKGAKGLGWVASQPTAAWRIATAVPRPISSALLQSYGSGHPINIGWRPYKLGMEVDMELPPGVTDGIPGSEIAGTVAGLWNVPKRLYNAVADRDAIGTDLLHWLGQGDVYATIYAYPSPSFATEEKGIELVENGLRRWNTRETRANRVPLLRVKFLRNGLNDHTRALTTMLGWNNQNYFSEHFSVGSNGRGRPFAYMASQLGRWFQQEMAGMTPVFDPAQSPMAQRAALNPAIVRAYVQTARLSPQ